MYRLTKNSFATGVTGLLIVSAVSLAAVGFASAAAPVPTPAGSTLQQRIDQRKAEQPTPLSPQDTQRITSGCVQVQGKIRTLQSDTATMLDTHAKTYGTIDARLWVAIGSLKFANQDTFQLQKERQNFSDKADAFNALGTNYKQTLDDAVVMNCAADPAGFRAVVVTAQNYYASLKAQSVENRDYIVNTVKPTLNGHTSDLQTKSTGEAN